VLRVIAALGLTLWWLALSACGGDGNDGSSQFQRAIEPDAQERAESNLLALADFPDGWRAEAPDEEDEEGDEAFNDCVGVDYSDLTVTGEASSDDFAMGETAQASSQAEVFESAEMAAEAVARFTQAFSGDQASACLSDSFAEFEDDQVEISGAQVGELSFNAPADVDDAHAWQVVFTIEGKPGTPAAGVLVTSYVDFLQVRKGDATAEVSTLDIETPFDPELRDQLVGAVADRLGG
jgi:hypothetical protein